MSFSLAEVMIVTELIKSQKQHNVTVIWHNESGEQEKVGLYDNKSNELLAKHSNDIVRYLARTVDPELYGKDLQAVWRNQTLRESLVKICFDHA